MIKMILDADNLKNGMEIGINGFASAEGPTPCQVIMEVYHDELEISVYAGGEEPAYAVRVPKAPVKAGS